MDGTGWRFKINPLQRFRGVIEDDEAPSLFDF